MRKHILILMLAAFALVAVVGPTLARGPNDHSWNDFPLQGENRTIAGLVERTDDGIAIISSGGHKYMVTGKISQPQPKKVVTVESVKEAK